MDYRRNSSRFFFFFSVDRDYFLASALSEDVAEVAVALGAGLGTLFVVGGLSYTYRIWRSRQSARSSQVLA